MRASLVKSFLSGFDNLATAKQSPLSLYKPTVVIKVWGAVIKSVNLTPPVVESINVGFWE